MDNLIAKLYQTQKTVLTSKDIALIWGEISQTKLKAKIAYYVNRKALIRLTRGVFAKDKNYAPRELATSLYLPSYISFETALRDSGIIFQHYDTIFVAGKWPKTMKIDGHIITFRRLKDELLFNPVGIIFKDNYNIAGLERAFLDMIYLFPEYYFDNLSSLNWEKCFEMVPMYKNKQMTERLVKYHKNYVK
ncbi:hypothetical protein A3J90_01020 [candidate division WOR-1 bacterium RIFOXYC2_FULL_37_10]|uniref:AbiEi antitoxin C-terminal domain-containing protein n=1 Tax=candidate division WOR-1 bacterium RIFOXYB2_FULL_37_13 TaxID=1802579 RepID=A0A1F4STQ4_UNCSA|nr:MAG: hypothetical protein A2246_04260 [candidate division WOR-1 bacterium RIFOXYA2_FULL_37_7]OGC23810.1 MAG: hypothetical protein A2310_04255 [candidate division WOR-1 bacterium RIFOXYB2_FULL_37_13]OGC33289.1 MAG: hypothetical protein A3J90_01020 [candidate division WOR-1 bacterium RIFOXYC2_FULL_37_10]